MQEIAQQAFDYLKESPLLSLCIAFIAGIAAHKSVVRVKRGNPALFLIIGALGTFLGQFAIRYLGLKETLDQVAEFALFFELIAAYIGSFIVVSLIHFIKPL